MHKGIIGLLIAIGVIGGGYVALTDTDITSIWQVSALDEGTVQQGNWGKVFGLSTDAACTFTGNLGGVDATGTVYVSGAYARADFTTMVDGSARESHMIKHNATLYVWADEIAQGVETSFITSTSPSAIAQNSFDGGAPVAYSCQSWEHDVAAFTLPETVVFLDAAALVQQQGIQ